VVLLLPMILALLINFLLKNTWQIQKSML
jgi:hypothetical protein